MLVLSIIGIIAGLIIIYMGVMSANRYTQRRFRFEFFDWAGYLLVALCDGLLYFGYTWYMEALSHSGGDLLNGQILMGLGSMVAIFIVYRNIKSSNTAIGVLGTLLQFVIFSGLAVVGFFAILMAIGAASQVRPVYSINGDR